MSRKVNMDEVEEVVYSVEREEISFANNLILLVFLGVVLYIMVPEVKGFVNKSLSNVKDLVSSSTQTEPDRPKAPPRSGLRTNNEREPQERLSSLTPKTISVALLFKDIDSVGSRFVGTAEGNYKPNTQGVFLKTSNYWGHTEPSKAVPDNTINRGFCSTPVSVRQGSNVDKVLAANRKCLTRLQGLSRKISKELRLPEQVREPELSLLLTAIDLGNQAREEVHVNMYTREIPRLLDSGKGITLVDIVRARRDAFKNSGGVYQSKLDTIPGLVRLARKSCGNTLEVNVILVDQVRRTVEAQASLELVGFGVKTVSRTEIIKQLCVRK